MSDDTASLPDRVTAKFKQARDSGVIKFLDTEVSILHCDGRQSLPFQLRYAPSLASKPQPKKDETDDANAQKKPMLNPFDNPDPALVITPIGSDHTLVLNKFPIIPGHSILITNANLPQTSPLAASDLAAIYRVLHEYEAAKTLLLGFFNSGKDSGASQPHRHVQFLPVEGMKIGMREGDEWEPLAFKLQDPDIRDALPFVTFNAPLKGNETGEQLKKAYHALLEVARGVHKSYLSPDPDVEGLYSETDTTSSEDEDDRDGEVGFSYNLAFTTKLITIMPRTAEGVTMTYDLVHGEKTEVQLNGTVLGGTLLVKDRGAYDAMMNEDEEDGIELGGILDQVGVPQRALASLLAGQVRH